jgi:hypothetical protein
VAIFRPLLQDCNQLNEPMNDGELEVARALEQLDDSWTVYVQPRLSTARPDFVVVHDRAGVCIVEVKDWSCGAYRLSDKGPIEFGRGDGTWTRSDETPRHQAFRYRSIIFDRFFALPDDNARPTQAVRAVVVMPKYTTAQACKLLWRHQVCDDEMGVQVFGGDDLTASIEALVRGTGCPPPHPTSVDRLRRELAQSEAARQHEPSAWLSPGARNIAGNPGNARIRRVRGPAGSGKSFGLAARAAILASQGRTSLVLTFNVTLANYLRTLVSARCREVGADPTLVLCQNFHSFCEGVATDAEAAGLELNRYSALNWPNRMVARAAEAFSAGFERQFDAVLIDEGQDFVLEWWNLLRNNVVAAGGEQLIVADPTQDLYAHQAWTDEERMLGAGFSGSWTDLKGSYRLPNDMVPLANEFSRRYLSGDRLAAEVGSERLPMSGVSGVTVRTWRNIDNIRDLGTSIGQEVVRLLSYHPDLAIDDVVFLCNDHRDGLDAVKVIEAAGHPVHHVFARSDSDKSRRKRRFWPDAPGVKGCTVHSFKGWEAPAIVMGIGRGERSKRMAYVALTRIKGPASGAPALLSVVNGDPQIAEFESMFTDWGPPQTFMRVGVPDTSRPPVGAGLGVPVGAPAMS